ncbi:MAG: hypothetical protein COA52_14585 [Hyphomicrobiales bacterium]|nr:MAG: hypothetical protein COA52_14585 [Hyphomicrobiales bacterium]
MRALFLLLFKFFRLGPIGLLLVACVLVGAGQWLQNSLQGQIDRRAAALAAGPPAVVEFSAFDPALHQSSYSEVRLMVQLDLRYDSRLTLEKSGTDHLAYMVPILPVEPNGDIINSQAVGVAIWDGSGFSFDDISPGDLVDEGKSFGAFGPILVLNGLVSSVGELDSLVDDALSEGGLVLAPDALILRPFLDGREAGLAPKPGLANTDRYFNIAAVLTAFLAVAKMLMGRGRKAKHAAPVQPTAMRASSQPRRAAAAPPPLPEPTYLVKTADVAAHRYEFQERLAERHGDACGHSSPGDSTGLRASFTGSGGKTRSPMDLVARRLRRIFMGVGVVMLVFVVSTGMLKDTPFSPVLAYFDGAFSGLSAMASTNVVSLTGPQTTDAAPEQTVATMVTAEQG